MGINPLSAKTAIGNWKRILSIVLFAGNHYKGNKKDRQLNEKKAERTE
jgi:hypothetical protein